MDKTRVLSSKRTKTKTCSIGIQTDDVKHEPPLNIFACTFHSNNAVETFCDLREESVDFHSSYDLFKTTIEEVKSTNEEPPPTRRFRKRKYENCNYNCDDYYDQLIMKEEPECQIAEDNDIDFKVNLKEESIHEDNIHDDEDDDDDIIEEETTSLKSKKIKTKKRLSKTCTLCTSRRAKRRCSKIAIHTTNNIKCKFCEHVDVSLKLLYEHSLKEHPTEIGEKVDESKALTKIKSHTRPSKLCKICSSRRDKRRCTKIAIHVNNNFRCKFCEYTCDSLKSLYEHALKEHFVEVAGKNSNKCNDCGQLFIFERYFVLHTKAQTCDICNKVIECQKNFWLHQHKAHPVTCDICEEVCPNKLSLSKHKLQHEAEKGNQVHKCISCNKVFSLGDRLERHRTLSICDKCPMRFDCITALRNHKYTVHPKYKCDFCFKTFPYASALNEHVATHSGTDSYSCDICDKTFACEKYVLVHKRTIHGYQNKFQCKYCPKTFYSEIKHDNHVRTHFEEKPFMCETCGAMFKLRKSLGCHIRIHHGVYVDVRNNDGSVEKVLVKYTPPKKVQKTQKKDKNIPPQPIPAPMPTPQVVPLHRNQEEWQPNVSDRNIVQQADPRYYWDTTMIYRTNHSV